MPEWPEGIPNPHHPRHSVGEEQHRFDTEVGGNAAHEQHHRAEEALLSHIGELTRMLKATRNAFAVPDGPEVADPLAFALANTLVSGDVANEAFEAVQALLAVRDAARLRRNFILWPHMAAPAHEGKWIAVPAEDFEALRRALQGLPEHLKGQA